MLGLNIFFRVQTFHRRPFALLLPPCPKVRFFWTLIVTTPWAFFVQRQPSLAKSWHEMTPGPRGRPVGICRFLEEFLGFFMFILTFCFWHQDFFFLLDSFFLTRELTSLVFSRLFLHNCHNIHFHFCSVNKTGISAPLQSARDSAKMIIKIN